MPDTLPRALRDVVDASADPVTVEEVLGLPLVTPQRTRWPLLLTAAAVVLLAVVAGLLVAGRGDDGAIDRQVTATTPTVATVVETPPLSSCLSSPIRDDVPGPCTVTDEQATAMIGFEINEPDAIPPGWTRVYSYLALYLDSEGDFPGDEDILQSRRTWYRDPEQQEVPCDTQWPPRCPGDHVQITVRRSVPGDEIDVRRIGPEVFLLDDGTSVHGSFFRDDAFLMWLADGRYYRVRTFGLDEATVRTIADEIA